jgi:hypothetical protein
MISKGQKGRNRTEFISSRHHATPDRGRGDSDGQDNTLRGVLSVRPSPGQSSSRFRDLAEAELFNERAAIREFDGGLPRAAAERLAWLDVLAARQLAAGALDHMADALADPS